MASRLWQGKGQNTYSHTSFLQDPMIRRTLTRVAIGVAVIGFSAMTGLLAAGEISRWLVLATYAGIIGLAGFLFIAERLHWGVLMLVFTAAFTPLSLPTGTASRIPDSMVVTLLFTVVWVARMLIVEKRFRLIPSPANTPALLWCIVAVVSLGWSMYFRDKQVVIWDSFPLVQVASAVLMIALPAAYLLVGNFATKTWVLQLMAGMMALLGFIALALNFTHINIQIVNRGGLMYMWAAGISLALALFDERLWLVIRAGLLGHAVGWVVWGFFMNISWMAGWLPGLLAMGLLVLIRSRKLVLLAIPIVIVAVFLNTDYFLDRFSAESSESGVTRLAAWGINWRVTSEHFLFGTGPGGYAAYYMTYFPHEAMATHNNYLDVLAQTGVVGLAIWLWLFGAILWQGFRLMLRLRGRRDFLEAMANMAFAGTIGCIVIMAFGDWLLPFAYTQTIAGFDYAVFNWIFMGTIVAIDYIAPQTPALAPEVGA